MKDLFSNEVIENVLRKKLQEFALYHSDDLEIKEEFKDSSYSLFYRTSRYSEWKECFKTDSIAKLECYVKGLTDCLNFFNELPK